MAKNEISRDGEFCSGPATTHIGVRITEKLSSAVCTSDEKQTRRVGGVGGGAERVWNSCADFSVHRYVSELYRSSAYNGRVGLSNVEITDPSTRRGTGLVSKLVGVLTLVNCKGLYPG